MAHAPYFALFSVCQLNQFTLRSLPRIQNKRFGNDRKNFKKSDQASKKSNVQKNAEKKDVTKKEEVKTESMDVDQSLR